MFLAVCCGSERVKADAVTVLSALRGAVPAHRLGLVGEKEAELSHSESGLFDILAGHAPTRSGVAAASSGCVVCF